jgi:hypothetical protein
MFIPSCTNLYPSDLNRKTFATESQAEGMIAMAMLSQQLADFNGEWEPKWEQGTGAKYCIHSRRSGTSKSVHPSLQI